MLTLEMMQQSLSPNLSVVSLRRMEIMYGLRRLCMYYFTLERNRLILAKKEPERELTGIEINQSLRFRPVSLKKKKNTNKENLRIK